MFQGCVEYMDVRVYVGVCVCVCTYVYGMRVCDVCVVQDVQVVYVRTARLILQA